jgi:hypothetical protein
MRSSGETLAAAMSEVAIADLLAILDQIESWAEWHCDPDAKINDHSPQDMHAHTNGLIMQACANARNLLANDSRLASADLETPNP